MNRVVVVFFLFSLSTYFSQLSIDKRVVAEDKYHEAKKIILREGAAFPAILCDALLIGKNLNEKDVQNLSTSLLQQILMNQQLILQSLENFNEGVKTDKKKKLLDRIFNYVVIFLIGVVFVFWIFYAITYL